MAPTTPPIILAALMSLPAEAAPVYVLLQAPVAVPDAALHAALVLVLVPVEAASHAGLALVLVLVPVDAAAHAALALEIAELQAAPGTAPASLEDADVGQGHELESVAEAVAEAPQEPSQEKDPVTLTVDEGAHGAQETEELALAGVVHVPSEPLLTGSVGHEGTNGTVTVTVGFGSHVHDSGQTVMLSVTVQVGTGVSVHPQCSVVTTEV